MIVPPFFNRKMFSNHEQTLTTLQPFPSEPTLIPYSHTVTIWGVLGRTEWFSSNHFVDCDGCRDPRRCQSESFLMVRWEMRPEASVCYIQLIRCFDLSRAWADLRWDWWTLNRDIGDACLDQWMVPTLHMPLQYTWGYMNWSQHWLVDCFSLN
jgi:hypothetical protein